MDWFIRASVSWTLSTVLTQGFFSGSVKVGEPVLLGPDANGNYQSTVIKTMQRKR